MFCTQEVESVDDPSRRAAAPNRRTPWLALIIAMVALVVTGSLVAAVLYVVSIDRAVNKNQSLREWHVDAHVDLGTTWIALTKRRPT
jgi:hypothetical protein